MSNEAVAKPKRSLDEKIIDATNYLNKLLAEKAALALINNVDVNDEVQFIYGRAEKKRTVTGVVKAKKATSTGLQLLVIENEGSFEAETYKPFARDLTANLTKAAAEPVVNPDTGYVVSLMEPTAVQPAEDVSVERQQNYDGIYPAALDAAE